MSISNTNSAAQTIGGTTGATDKALLVANGAAGATLQATPVLVDPSTGTVTLPDAANVVLNATTGTKIGTATTQKLAVYGSTPIVQGASVADASGGAVIDAEARAAINAVISRLEAFGLIATV
jgi:hypothetical protein